MDKGVQGQYVQFLKSGAGQDLINRLKSTEATYMMQGMKAETMEQKAIAMTKMQTVYNVRTMLDDLSKPIQSQSISSAGSDKNLTKPKH
jgi:hypothetical protein